MDEGKEGTGKEGTGHVSALYRHQPSANQAAMRPLTADMIYPAMGG